MKSKIAYISYIFSAMMISLFIASTSYAQAGGGPCANTEVDPTGKSAGTPTAETLNAAGQGSPACGTLEQTVSSIKSLSSSFSAQKLDKHKYEELQKGYDEYIKNRKSCLSDQASANTMCMDGLSPDLANGAADINNLLSSVGGTAKDNCGKASQAMDMAKAALSAFNGSCGTARGMCNSSCKKATEGANTLKNKALEASSSATCTDPNIPTCQATLTQYKALLAQAMKAGVDEVNETDQKAVAGKSKTCQQNYGKQLASALGGIMSMLQGMQQANGCEEETSGESNPTATAEKCLIEANATLPECICLKNPRTPGCSNAYNAANSSGEIGTGLTDRSNVDPSRDVANIPNVGNQMEHGELPSDSGSGGIGAPTGGGAGIGSSTVGSGSGPGGKDDGGGRKGLNANILGGTGGGGGSGGGMGGGGSGDKYRAYLPGGAKDPSKAVAGQQAWTKEVTGQGGKSNWEKVKERYKDNRNTLLNN